MKQLLLLLLLPISAFVFAQRIEIVTSGTATSIRGLSVVNDKIIWVSGSNGRVGKSLDGGKSWKWMIVQNYEKRDFRDIEAFGKDTAIIMAIAEPANILKTTNGGDTWEQVYENNTKGMFLDAMEFYDGKSGTVIGDPINGKFFIAATADQGATWKELPGPDRPVADSGEACFASSGTNIRQFNGGEACFISGGTRSRYFTSRLSVGLPFAQGTSTTGANSIAVQGNGSRLVVVGGNYAVDSISVNNCFISADAGATWKSPAVSPHGYRSCVEFISKNKLITCGTSGIDISKDGGMNWKLISKESFHVCRKAKNGTAVYLAGSNGRIAKLID